MPEGGTLNVAARRIQGSGSGVRGIQNGDLDADQSQVTRHAPRVTGSESEPGFIEMIYQRYGTGHIRCENMKNLFQPLFTTRQRE